MNKAEIKISQDKLVEGTIYKGFIAMCRGLNVLINDVPCIKSPQVGSRKNAIIKKVREYADLTITPSAKKGGKEIILIGKIYSTPQPKQEISELLRPILRKMVNDEQLDVSIIKHHKGLSVDLDYMAQGYGKLCAALYKDKEIRAKEFALYGIDNEDEYAEYLIKKLRGKISNHLKTCCGNLDYDGVYTYRTPIDLTDYDFLDGRDQQLYTEFKEQARAEIDAEWLPIKEQYEKMHNKEFRINYQDIPVMTNQKFNTHKKSIDPAYKPIRTADAWVFEVDGGFQEKPQITQPHLLNTAILDSFLVLLNLQALENYVITQEYQQIKAESNWFLAKSGYLCSDKEVRQALTKTGRDRTAEKKGIDERDIGLDFSLLNIESYIDDIKAIVIACQI